MFKVESSKSKSTWAGLSLADCKGNWCEVQGLAKLVIYYVDPYMFDPESA